MAWLCTVKIFQLNYLHDLSIFKKDFSFIFLHKTY